MRFQWLSVALLVAFIAGCKDDSEDTQLPTVPASVKLSETLLYPSREQHNYPEQKQRVRHVLTYSPLLPGPKVKLPAKSGIRAAESTREQD